MAKPTVAAAETREGRIPNEAGADLLRSVGLRVTMPRLAVLGLVTSTGEHLSADAVRRRLHERGIDLQRSSVFNVLDRLSRAGLVKRVEVGGATRFERDDGMIHDHFRCTSCGTIENVAAADVAVPAVAGRVDASSVLHIGLCPACLGNEASG